MQGVGPRPRGALRPAARMRLIELGSLFNEAAQAAAGQD